MGKNPNGFITYGKDGRMLVLIVSDNRHKPESLAKMTDELCGKVGDGVNQAADLISATASIPSLNFIPLTTFGNWF